MLRLELQHVNRLLDVSGVNTVVLALYLHNRRLEILVIKLCEQLCETHLIDSQYVAQTDNESTPQLAESIWDLFARSLVLELDVCAVGGKAVSLNFCRFAFSLQGCVGCHSKEQVSLAGHVYVLADVHREHCFVLLEFFDENCIESKWVDDSDAAGESRSLAAWLWVAYFVEIDVEIFFAFCLLVYLLFQSFSLVKAETVVFPLQHHQMPSAGVNLHFDGCIPRCQNLLRKHISQSFHLDDFQFLVLKTDNAFKTLSRAKASGPFHALVTHRCNVVLVLVEVAQEGL